MPIKKNKLTPKFIPELPAGTAAIGKEGFVKRSFSGCQGDIIRLPRGALLDLSVELASVDDDVVVVCYTNLNRASWRSVPFDRYESAFRLSVRAKRCGVFGFRVKYSLDRGTTWIWDRVPLVYVHVDPPSMNDVRAYTLLPNTLGKVDRWIDRLDHIQRLGFNMVHLLPVTEMDDSESPYSARDLFAFDPSYYDPGAYPNGMAAFEHFVEAAKSRGISLCIDLVLNHIGPGSLIGQKCPEWIMPDKEERDGMKRSGCWHMNAWLKWQDLVKIYYDHPNEEKRAAVWDYMKAYALFWANFAAYTGGMIRLDNLHNSDEDFIAFILVELRKAYPDLIIHAEFFSDSNTVLKRAREWDLNLLLANPWEYPYAENLREYLRYIHEISGAVQFYVPVTTHDTGAPAELFGAGRAVVPRYFVTALFSTGKTGMVQGCEAGVPRKVEFIGRHRTFPYQPDPWISRHITRINRLLATHDALRASGNLVFVDNDHGAVLGAYRSSKDADRPGILLLANLDTEHEHRLTVDLASLTGQAEHRLEDAMGQAAPVPAGSQHTFVLPPLGTGAYLLTHEKRRAPTA